MKIKLLANLYRYAGVAAIAVAAAGLALAGGAGMTTMTTVFSIYQTLLPAWVRGRASSVAMRTASVVLPTPPFPIVITTPLPRAAISSTS